MSASVLSPSSLRCHALPTQELDPTLSFAHTSAYSAAATSVLEASTLSYNGVLTQELIEEGFSDLGRTGDGTQMSYLSLNLHGRSLEDLSLLASYSHLQKISLASNNLSDLSVLSHLPFLVHLDVSYNKLTTILDFEPPKNLLEVNYSHNEIEEICDLSPHHSLRKLLLNFNQITGITGVSGLQCLTHLSLADNRIEQIANLDHLPLKYLNLSGNSIRVIENLETLTQLQVLDLSGNHISSLRGLEHHPYLMDVNLEENEVVDLREVEHLKSLRLLRSLNLSRNPVEALGDYRPVMLFHLSSLVRLDNRRISVEEKVAALNRFAPPTEVGAAHNHRTNVTNSVHKAARLRFSTLTRLEEPYPMLVLCGPPGSGKGYLARLLVEEFPSFFGLGVSHTTRPQRSKESHGRDYYFIDEATFERAAKSGEFIQTFRRSGYCYGLTMAAVEQVAQQGLACVTHLSIEGVLSLKNTHFEPRYILTLPLTPQIHEQRLKAECCYSDAEIKKALQDVHLYKELHQQRPGFFDTAINTDSPREGYTHLRALVMAYGDISPESPLSLASTSQQTTQQTTTSLTTSEQTTPQPTNSGTCTPSYLLEPSEMGQTGQTSRTGYVLHHVTPEAFQQIQNAARAWSRPSSSLSGSRPVSGRQRSRTPALSDQGGRRHKQVRAAVAGKEALPYEESIQSGSRPGTSLSKSGGLHGGEVKPAPTTQRSEEEIVEDSSEESSDEDESECSASGSSLSKLSSKRGFSPENPASPQSAD